jgi:phosphohistidine phosphatase
MKNLILIRHAKSSWDAPLADKDRPLSKRGINDAHLVANSADEHLPKSFIVWSSTAQRAKNTAYIFAESLSIPIETIVFKDDLYTFDEDKLETAIKSCDNQFDNLILLLIPLGTRLWTTFRQPVLYPFRSIRTTGNPSVKGK